MGAGPSSSTPDNSNDAKEPEVVKSLSAKFKTKFSIESTRGKENIQVYRMVTLLDGRVCVIDPSKSFFQLLSEDYVLHDEVHLLGCCGCTCVDDNTIAVAVMRPKESHIVWYSVTGNKITEIEEKAQIDGIISDLAYRDGEYIVRYEKEGSDCTRIGDKCIVKRKRETFNEENMLYDAASDSVIQSNFAEKTITCYKPNGNVKWRVTIDGLPGGLVVINGVVLVSDQHRNVVRQITIDGRQLATPLLSEEDDIQEPTSIAYQKHMQRLLVGKASDKTCMVFDLSDSQ